MIEGQPVGQYALSTAVTAANVCSLVKGNVPNLPAVLHLQDVDVSTQVSITKLDSFMQVGRDTCERHACDQQTHCLDVMAATTPGLFILVCVLWRFLMKIISAWSLSSP
jgi:hypothetical protein